MKTIFSIHHYDSSRLMHSSQLEGLELAGFARRFFALVIDLLILFIILYGIGMLLNAFHLIHFGLSIGVSSDHTEASLPEVHNGIEFNVPEVFKVIIKLAIPVLYFGLFIWFTNGYTIGKRLLRIRIVSTNHKHITLWHSIERSIGYYASSLEFGFGFLQYFIDYNRRTVHDRIAETIVITV
jgi:uncharacterized RDD family membrane protein YckC